MSPFQDSLPSALNPVINSMSVKSGLLGGEGGWLFGTSSRCRLLQK